MPPKIGHFVRANQKIVLQVTLSFLFIGLGIYFLRHERAELNNVAEALGQANLGWVGTGLLLVGLFILVQGWMYQYSFRAIHRHISLSTSLSLYLKRNLISVFLPAGMLTNLLFFNKEVERKEGVARTDIYFASSIFSLCSILSTIVVGLPVVIFLFFRSGVSLAMILGLIVTLLLLGVLSYAVMDFRREGQLFRWLGRTAPSVQEVIRDLRNNAFDRRHFLTVLLLSCIIEVIGIAHLYIAIAALGGHPGVEVAVVGYALVLLLLMSSPFLRGIGAIEVTLTYVLTLYGFSTVAAISMAFLFRFFEFWLLLALGMLALVAQRDSILVRFFPVALLFLLGLVNIVSALTPGVPHRLQYLRDLLPLEAIHASTYLVLFSGVLMLALAAYLLRGLYNAWLLAVILSALSLLGHLTKGIDFEEASLALLTLAALVYQRRQYFIRPDWRLARRSLFPGLMAVGGVWLFGTLGFFFLHERHFHTDFTLWEAFQEAVTSFFLLNVDLTPATRFAHEFLYGLQGLGGITMAYIAFLLFRPLIERTSTDEEDRIQARTLVDQYGRTQLDYFKIYNDKHFFFSEDKQSFIAFKVAGRYAIALENPVSPSPEAMKTAIRGFDEYCRKGGLQSAYYRISETDIAVYEGLGKKIFPIGEEASVDLTTFTLQGKEKGSLRNAINKINKAGYLFKAYDPPQRDGLLQQLRAVSDDWLRDMDRSEMTFSQGRFDEEELKQQTILTMESPEGRIEGFVNLIPNYVPGEANFDLMRKTADAPNGTMDFLFIRMFEYLQSKGFTACNLGMAPLSGIDAPTNLQEQIIKTAYERLGRFAHYRGLREFKEKFNPCWTMKYLAYDIPLDLIYLPQALNQVMEEE